MLLLIAPVRLRHGPCRGLDRAVDTHEFAAALVEKGYTHLMVQKGTGAYVPCNVLQEPGSPPPGLKVE